MHPGLQYDAPPADRWNWYVQQRSKKEPAFAEMLKRWRERDEFEAVRARLATAK